MPLLIPGSGKSVFAEVFEEMMRREKLEIPFKIIHSDLIRKKIVDEKKESSDQKGKQRPEEEELFKLSQKEAASEYKKQIKKELAKPPHCSNEVLFIDRVFCPTTLLRDLKDYSRPYVKFVLLTQTFTPITLGSHEYPFTLRYVLICLKRCLERGEHETLSTKPY